MKTDPLKISVSADGPPFRLMATNYGRTEIAGPRLFRGGNIPAIQWSHISTEQAHIHARKLQDYLDELTRTSKVSKRALRTFGS